jgi:hypothetical protein
VEASSPTGKYPYEVNLADHLRAAMARQNAGWDTQKQRGVAPAEKVHQEGNPKIEG